MMKHVAKMIVQNKLKIVLWGAGKNCHTYLKLIEEFCQIEMIVDINPSLCGTYIEQYVCKTQI